MLVGKPPFKGASDWLTFLEVKKASPVYPPDLPESAKDLLQKTFITEPESRIGSKDLSDLRNHQFFEGIDWENISKMDPPTWVGEKADEDGKGKDNSGRSSFNGTDSDRDELESVPFEIHTGYEEPRVTRVTRVTMVSQEGVLPPMYKESKSYERVREVKMGTRNLLKFLKDGEKIIFVGSIIKHSFSGVSLIPRKRELILTSNPRILYVDPKKAVIRGEIPWSNNIQAQANSRKVFTIASKGRKYTMKCLSHETRAWVEIIESVKKQLNKLTQSGKFRNRINLGIQQKRTSSSSHRQAFAYDHTNIFTKSSNSEISHKHFHANYFKAPADNEADSDGGGAE
mmetsp:Transcript_8092/g.11461  ORF Transcript_8092/g.11461 Transcript_8092/m.11461 type:complete len:342 (+) Transcript_8092:570-1595(+)